MENTARIIPLTKGTFGTIEIAGDVTGQAEDAMVAAFDKLEKDGMKKILLRFNKATYINSSGLAIIISLVADSKKNKQTVVASGLSRHFQKIFEMIGLTEYVKIYETEDEAAQSLLQ